MEVAVKCIVGLFWGTHFQHGGKFVPQNSPTMHFDNHLDPDFRATSKWRMEETVDGDHVKSMAQRRGNCNFPAGYIKPVILL